jgi:hypothetical protein
MSIFLDYIDNQPLKAWEIVAEWYLNDLFDLLDKKDIHIMLTMSPNKAIDYLGRNFYKGHKRLYSLDRVRTRVIYSDFDTESDEYQVMEWKSEVWHDILECMSEVSYDLHECLKYEYDQGFANDFLSMVGNVDARTIYGILYKRIEDPDIDTNSENGSLTDGDYEPDDY